MAERSKPTVEHTYPHLPSLTPEVVQQTLQSFSIFPKTTLDDEIESLSVNDGDSTPYDERMQKAMKEHSLDYEHMLEMYVRNREIVKRMVPTNERLFKAMQESLSKLVTGVYIAKDEVILGFTVMLQGYANLSGNPTFFENFGEIQDYSFMTKGSPRQSIVDEVIGLENADAIQFAMSPFDLPPSLHYHQTLITALTRAPQRVINGHTPRLREMGALMGHHIAGTYWHELSKNRQETAIPTHKSE